MFKTREVKNHSVPAAAQPGSVAVDRQTVNPASTPASCIGSAMSIVGDVVCNGPALVFGRIEGELRATELVIGEGGQVDGSVQALDVTINGRVTGTIRAIRVRLLGATVEGDIIHRTLSIDENSVFQGMSRRVENPVEHHHLDQSESPSRSVGESLPKAIEASPLLVPVSGLQAD